MPHFASVPLIDAQMIPCDTMVSQPTNSLSRRARILEAVALHASALQVRSDTASRRRSPKEGRFFRHFASQGRFFRDFSTTAPTVRGLVA